MTSQTAPPPTLGLSGHRSIFKGDKILTDVKKFIESRQEIEDSAEKYRSIHIFNRRLVVTAITYGMASSRGGIYIATWGAVIFGAIQFFRGLFIFISA
jgi:hypothetical protein